MRIRFFSNGGLGINLVGGSENGYCVTANDTGDGDSGPNNLQNHPVLTSAHTSGAIVGSLNSGANLPYRIDFYSNATADPSGNGEGQMWVGSTTVTTDRSGNASFNVTVSALTNGAHVTATATGTGTSGAGTSEFAADTTVSP